MDNQISVNNVMRRVLAQTAPTPPAVGTQPSEPGTPTQDTPAESTRRYYYYEALPENSIDFTKLSSLLDPAKQNPTKEATVKKLQGGNSGNFHADFFTWKRIVIVTNKYSPGGKGLIVYSVNLSAIGIKVEGSEKIFPQNSSVDANKFEGDFGVFASKSGNSNVLNMDTGDDSYYVQGEPPANIEKLVSTGAVPPGVTEQNKYNLFRELFKNFRIWVPNMNRLLNPDWSNPTTDNVPGGYYKGGEDAFKAVAGTVATPEQKPLALGQQQRSLGEQVEKEEKGRFEPVQKENSPTKGDVIGPGPGLDKSAAIKKKEKKRVPGDYAEVPYAGGTDVVQRLFYDQHEKMLLRKEAQKKMAQRIVLAVAGYQTVAPATQPATTQPTGAKFILEAEPRNVPPGFYQKKKRLQTDKMVAQKAQNDAEKVRLELEKKYPPEQMSTETDPRKINEMQKSQEQYKKLQERATKTQDDVDTKERRLVTQSGMKTVYNKMNKNPNISGTEYQKIKGINKKPAVAQK